MLYDISPRVTPNLAVWPGDTPPQREVLLDMSRGDTLTLSTLRSTVHLGAHADAPNHYGLNAPSIDERPLERYLGPCRVVRADVAAGARVGIDDLQGRIETERLLIVTGSFPDPEIFRDDFAALEPALVHELHRRGVRLVGLDTPSVDLFDSRELPAHHACLECDMAILEGLVLSDVPDGEYELIALPLRLVGFDASPVRAVLRSLTA